MRLLSFSGSAGGLVQVFHPSGRTGVNVSGGLSKRRRSSIEIYDPEAVKEDDEMGVVVALGASDHGGTIQVLAKTGEGYAGLGIGKDNGGTSYTINAYGKAR